MPARRRIPSRSIGTSTFSNRSSTPTRAPFAGSYIANGSLARRNNDTGSELLPEPPFCLRANRSAAFNDDNALTTHRSQQLLAAAVDVFPIGELDANWPVTTGQWAWNICHMQPRHCLSPIRRPPDVFVQPGIDSPNGLPGVLPFATCKRADGELTRHGAHASDVAESPPHQFFFDGRMFGQ